MAFHLSLPVLFLCAKEKAVLTFSSKSFRPKGPKIFLATKSKNLGASWPQGFFLKSSPACTLILPQCSLKMLYLKPVGFKTFNI